MTTRAEIKDALETIRPRLQAWQIDDALKVVMPLLNRADRTAGTVEVCELCRLPPQKDCEGHERGMLGFESCPIRSGAKA